MHAADLYLKESDKKHKATDLVEKGTGAKWRQGAGWHLVSKSYCLLCWCPNSDTKCDFCDGKKHHLSP